MRPSQGPNLQPRHVPWPGIELVTFHFVGRCPARWATLLRALSYWCVCLSLRRYHPPWITLVFWLSFEIGKHESSNFVFYFKIISAILGPLQFHMNLRIILSINRFTINTNQDRTVNSRCHWHFSLEWIRKKTERRYVMVTAFGHQRFYYNSIHEMGNNLLCPNN